MVSRILQLAVFGACICCLVSVNIECAKEHSEYRARTSANWVRDAVLYEVDLRSHSGQRAFRDLQSLIPELKRIGFTVVCLMPVFPAGELNRQERSIDSYATRDYYGVNPEFGSMEDFDSLVSAVHNEGLKIIIDLAAGYAAWDSQILLEHPEWFAHNAEGAIVSPDPSLPDVAGLNYDHHELRKYMIAIMKHWIRDVGVDGFRCKTAESVPLDFWSTARNELDKIKPVMMISDAALPAHHVKAFDLTYSWNACEIFEKIEQDSLSSKSISELLEMEHNRYPQGSLLLRSDVDCSNGPKTESPNREEAARAVVFDFCFPGVPMISSRRFDGGPGLPDLFGRKAVRDRTDSAMVRLCHRLAEFRSHHPAAREGVLQWLETSDSEDVCTFARIIDGDTVLAVINLSTFSKKISTTIPVGASSLWFEYFRGKTIQTVDSMLEIQLSSSGYALLYPITEGKVQ
jgi:cyclomaltodextrinase